MPIDIKTDRTNPEPAYVAARMIAPVIEKHFAQHLEAAYARGEGGLAHQPPAHIIETLIDVTFWASLRREEGNSPKISLALLPPVQAGKPLLFENRLQLTPRILTKLAPGVERPGIHLGVWYDETGLYIWGTTHQIPNYCFVLDVSEPGLLVIKHRRIYGFGKFTNIAVLTGDQIKVINEDNASLPDCPALLMSLLSILPSSNEDDSVNVLIQLAVSMRAHGHGGLLLVVPSESNAWKNSILHPVQYSIVPAFSGLTELISEEADEMDKNAWLSALNREVDSLAGLTAVDGATIINTKHEVLAFGAKIIRPEGKAQVEQILFSEPVTGGEAILISPSTSGGTRHISAAQFVHDQRDSIALVASQDGRFTVFAWSPCDDRVHSHRIDALLL